MGRYLAAVGGRIYCGGLHHNHLGGALYMRYQVRFVHDDSLPGGVEFAFVRQAGQACLFIKQSAIDADTGRCDALTRAWTLWQSVELEEPARSLESGTHALNIGRLVAMQRLHL